MRIIGGRVGRRRLKAPRGESTRPTAEKVREALFDILGAPPAEARVLDLFAGAGALGLEALSRGATRAVFVERSREAVKCLTENVEALGMTEESEIHRTDALRALGKLEERRVRFDWVFLDPPYRSEIGARALEVLGAGTLLSPEAVVVLEHDRRRPPDPRVGCLVKADTRRYGDTAISFFRLEQHEQT